MKVSLKRFHLIGPGFSCTNLGFIHSFVRSFVRLFIKTHTVSLAYKRLWFAYSYLKHEFFTFFLSSQKGYA